jgi:hypothetical protein
VAIVADGRVVLVFRSALAGGVLRIRSVDGAQVAVTASQDGSLYTVGHQTIVVEGGAPGTVYDIALPSAERVAEVTIRVGERAVFVRHGGVVRTNGVVQPDGSYLVADERR